MINGPKERSLGANVPPEMADNNRTTSPPISGLNGMSAAAFESLKTTGSNPGVIVDDEQKDERMEDTEDHEGITRARLDDSQLEFLKGWLAYKAGTPGSDKWTAKAWHEMYLSECAPQPHMENKAFILKTMVKHLNTYGIKYAADRPSPPQPPPNGNGDVEPKYSRTTDATRGIAIRTRDINAKLSSLINVQLRIEKLLILILAKER